MFKRLGLWLGVGVLGMVLLAGQGKGFAADISTGPGEHLSSAGDVTVDGDSNIEAGPGSTSYTVSAGNTVTIGGSHNLTITGVDSSASAALNVFPTGVLNLNTTGSVVISNAGSSISSTGTVNVNNTQPGTAVTEVQNSGLIVMGGTGVLSVGDKGKITNSDTAALTVLAGGSVTNAGTIDNSGYLNNEGSITNDNGIINLLSGSKYNGGGTIDNSTGTMKIDAGITDNASANAVQSVFTDLTDNIGDIDVEGVLRNNLDKNTASAGTVNLLTRQAEAGNAPIVHNIDIGAATLNLEQGGVFSGTSYTAGDINLSGDTTFTNTAVTVGSAAGDLAVKSGVTLTYDTGAGNSGVATVDSSNTQIDGSLKIAAGDRMAYTNALNFAATGASVSLTRDATDAADTLKITAASLTGTGVANSVALNLDGGTKNWAGVDVFDVGGLFHNAIFYAGRAYVDANGFIRRKDTYQTFSPILNNRNAVNVGGYFDYVANQTNYANKDNLDDFLDEIYVDMLAGGGGSASRRLGATQSQHAVYVREGLMLAHDAFWNGLDRRRDLNLDLNYDLAALSSRRAPAPRPGATRSDDAYSVGSYSAFGDLVPPNCYPSRGRTVRDRNGGYSYAGGNSTVWADYIGSYAKQKSRNGIAGYDARSNGLSLGYEYRLGLFTFGAAASYARTNVDVDRYNADIDTNALNLALYADFNHSSGFFARGALGFSYGWNDYRARGAGYHRSGDVHNLIWNVNLQAGYAVRTRFVNIIPSLGLRFSNLRQDGWTERDRTAFGLDSKLGRRRDYSVDLPLEVRLNKTFAFGGVLLSPEVKAGYVYAAKRNRASLKYSLNGAPGHTSIYGVDSGRSRGILGAGVRAKFGGMVDAGLDYNFEFAKRYRQHNLTASVGVSF